MKPYIPEEQHSLSAGAIIGLALGAALYFLVLIR